MKIEALKNYKIGDSIDWNETIDGRRTGFRMGYFITRINYKRGLVWGKHVNAPLWDNRSVQLNLDHLGEE
jgi:hypothetical protein